MILAPVLQEGVKRGTKRCPLWVTIADMCAAKGNVRFTPNSDRESGHPQEFMSALPPESGPVERNSGCPLWAKSGHRTPM